MSFFRRDALQIIVFQSYGTNTHFYIRGRAIEDENIDLEHKNIFNLFINSWKRFESDEIKNTHLTITLPNQSIFTTKTDKDGYFVVNETVANLSSLTTTKGWLNFEVSYTNTNIVRKINNQNRFSGALLIPSNKIEFGVISDIDDTILHTGVISKLKWKLLLNTMFVSPFKRKALEGSSKFYNLLHLGKSGVNANPFFYVSHSPWNLYRYLDSFLNTNNFPKGAILLRTAGNIFKKKAPLEKPQKHKEIIHILETYADLSLILIGDAGEHDASIYMEITKNYPNRIKAIYLRSVNDIKRMKRIEALIENYSDTKFLIVNASREAIAHAKIHGLIA